MTWTVCVCVWHSSLAARPWGTVRQLHKAGRIADIKITVMQAASPFSLLPCPLLLSCSSVSSPKIRQELECAIDLPPQRLLISNSDSIGHTANRGAPIRYVCLTSRYPALKSLGGGDNDLWDGPPHSNSDAHYLHNVGNSCIDINLKLLYVGYLFT